MTQVLKYTHTHTRTLNVAQAQLRVRFTATQNRGIISLLPRPTKRKSKYKLRDTFCQYS